MQKVVAAMGVLLAMVAGAATPGWAGWVIDETVRAGANDRHAQQRLYLQSNLLKSVSLEGGKPAQAMIMNLEAQTLTHIDYARRAYMSATVKEYAEAVREGMQNAGDAMKQMEEQLKQLPPEQRKQVEAMIRSQQGGARQPAPTPEQCVPSKIDIKSTGKRATVAGFEASSYEIFNNDLLDSEVWIAPAITAVREIDPEKLERMVKEMTAAFPKCPPRGQMFGADPVWKLMKDGYPVRSLEKAHGYTTEVTKAESRALPSAEFQAPAGFTRKTLKEMMGGK